MFEMGTPPNKTMDDDFNRVLKLLKDRTNFAFSRFSDGELYMIMNEAIVMASDHIILHGQKHVGRHSPDDCKVFDPELHQNTRNLITKAFQYVSPGYIKGICCHCCVGQENYDQQWRYIEYKPEELTWSNLLINSNYPRYVEEMVGGVFREREINLVCTKFGDISEMPFKVKKDWRIGPNAMNEDQDIIGEISDYIEENNIVNEIFLFAASSLSNIAIKYLWEHLPNNTYIDVGSSLNLWIKGIAINRDYLQRFYNGIPQSRSCIW